MIYYTCCPNVSLDTCGPNCVDKTTITVSHRHSSCLSIYCMLGCLSLSTCCLNSVIDRQINTSFIHSFIVCCVSETNCTIIANTQKQGCAMIHILNVIIISAFLSLLNIMVCNICPLVISPECVSFAVCIILRW